MLENLKILVVEDENIIAMDIRCTLKNLGYDVCGVVSSGEESVRKASSMSPDLILMDIKLRGNMDGISAAKRIQSRSNIPVLYLTAYGDEKTMNRLDKTKPFGFIQKPFAENELQYKINNVIHGDKENHFN